jgi:hypothetical protein
VRALPANTLQVRDPAGRSSVARSVDARAAGGRHAGEDGSSMLRTGATSAAGAYTLQSAQAQGRYVVQVLEPNSPLRLEVQANQAQVLAGGSVQLQARLLEDGATTAQLASRRGGLGGEALLVAPDGRSWPQRLLRTTDGALRAQVRIPADVGSVQGLWELQVFAQADGVLRDGKVAFAVARPTARFSGQAAPDPASRQVALPLQVAAAGRYEARGTLYATGRDGQLKPVAQACSGVVRWPARASWCCRSTRPHCRPASVRRTSCATCSCRTRAGWHRSSRARWRCGSEQGVAGRNIRC